MNERETDYRQFERERIISVSDLFEEILRKIWLVIILAVVFAVLLAGYKYMSDKSKAEKSAGTVSFENMVNSLTDGEIREVNNILELYDSAEAAELYLNESVRMNIDSYHEERVLMQFALEAGDANLTEILQMIQNYVTGGPLAAGLQEYYPDTDTTYLAELVTIDSASPTLDVSGLESAVYQSNIFSVRVIHEDADACQQLADAVQHCLDTYLAGLSEYFGACEITLIDAYVSQVYDSSLKSTQATAVSDYVTLLGRINTLTGYLSDTQAEVLDAALAAGTYVERGSEEAVDNAGAGTASVKVHISRRYTVYGLLIGIVVGIVLIILYYLCRGTLNIAQEMQSVFNVPVFGQVHVKRQRNPLVRGWRRVTRKKKAVPTETEQRIALTNLENYCKSNQIDRILLTGSREDLAEDPWLKEVQSALRDDQIEAEIMGGLPDSPEALEKMNACPCVALVETLHASIYKDVVREMELCAEQQVQVTGAIVLD